MEQHPVPQNILEVEFKLFGSFTLKQFSKILFGSLAALLLFFIPMPEIIKLPVMAASVLLGIGLAVVPNLGTWFGGYLKALFISPRYVWKKETITPDILKPSVKKEIINRQQVARAQNDRKIDISQISLNELVGTRVLPRNASIRQVLEDNEDPVLAKDINRETNLDRLYSQLYTRIQEKKAKQSAVANTMPTELAGVQQKSNTPNPNIAEDKQTPQPMVSKLVTPEDYQNEINRLKQELQNLIKDQNYKERETDILNQINELYQHLKFNQHNYNSQIQATNQQGKNLGPGQHVLGIVVDKEEQIVANAQVIFRDAQTDAVTSIITNTDGKFSTIQSLPQGEYDVTIVHPEKKFHKYKIQVGSQPLPAYKFRAK